MASTKSTGTPRRRTTASKSATRRTTAPKARTSSDKGFMATVKDRPVASAAIGTGLLTGIAAAVAGFFAFKKSGKSWDEFSGDVAEGVKDKASEASEFVKDGLAEAKAKVTGATSRRKDGTDEARSQSEIAEEALTLKETGEAGNPPASNQEAKAGAKAYN